jgi:SAM-dependent MidA family methyltransferase
MNIGCQDITAHVNFSSLKDWGHELGLKTIGYCPQGTFLASLGIDEIISKELQKDPAFELELLKIKGLLFDMGESHQVMIQHKGNSDIQDLRGFKLKNRVDKL